MSSPEKSDKMSWFHKALPALTLMVMAPLIAEVMPGATRMSALAGFPLIFVIEVLIWGGGAVMIRFLVRKYRLGWFNLVLLAAALAVAEECLIQQTTLAPLVIQIKGVEYARAFGINYVYGLWALLYEAIFVVCVPIAFCEMLFPSRREQGWLSGWGIALLAVLFLPACFLAWYSWTHIARTTVFHLPAYDLPPLYAAVAAGLLAFLILLAVGPVRRLLAAPARPMTPPHPLVLAVLSGGVAAVIFGIEVLAFGAKPDLSPVVPMAVGLVLLLVMLFTVPGWMASPKWSLWHALAMTCAVTLGNFAILFVGFGDNPLDLYGKIALDGLGALLMLWLAVHALKNRP